jgi:hypothetical protein
MLTGGSGDDILIGGAFSDTLLGGSDFDILFGDNGVVTYSDGQPWIAETTRSPNGGIDYLDGGPGTDVLFGGEGTDIGVGEFPADALIGQYGRVIIENGKIVSIFPPIQLLFGSPISDDTGALETPGFFDAGSVIVGSGLIIATEAGIIITSETGLIGRLPLTHSYSFALNAGASFYEPEFYSEPETEEGLQPDTGDVTTFTHPDGTIERTFLNGTIETIKPDGTVITKSPDGTTTVRTPDGTMTVTSPDGTTITTSPDGTITTTLPDGTVIEALPDGTTIKTLPDGTIITTTPDGTIIKTLPQEQGGLDNSLLKIEQNDIELNFVVAGLTGWGLASSRPSKGRGRSILNRKAFKKLDREKELRRFMRWQDGRFEDFVQGSNSRSEREAFPSNSFQLLNFIDRRTYGEETRN